MKKVLTIVRKEYLERVRSKSFVIGTLLGPALMSLVIVLPILLADSGADDVRTIGVIDFSGEFFAPLEEVLADQGRENIRLLSITSEGREQKSSIEELKSMILQESVHSGIVIGEDFVDSREVSFYNKSVSSLVLRDEVLRPAVNRVLRESRFAAAEVPANLFTYLVSPSLWSSINVTASGDEEIQDENVSIAMAFVLIMIIYIMVMMYGSHTLTAVIEEKTTRMAEVMLASVSPENLMLGKVLGIGMAGLTQFGIWTAAFFFISKQGVSVGEMSLDVSFLTPVILISFVMFFLLGFFLYATLYAGIGAMCNTIQDSQQFHMPVAMGLILPMMMLSLVLRSPDSTLSVVLSLVPMFSPVLMFVRVCVETPPLWQIGLSWLLMTLSILLTSRLAGKLFRLGILMYGASPTWGSLLRALRG